MKCQHCDSSEEGLAYRKYSCYYCKDTGQEIQRAIVREITVKPLQLKFRNRLKELLEQHDRKTRTI